MWKPRRIRLSDIRPFVDPSLLLTLFRLQTGLRGMSGNKGAVGIRLDYHDSSFCFVTAHLAAGHSNIDERNADYHTIRSGLHFLKGKTLDSHQ